MSTVNAFGSYLKQDVEGASEGRLVVMLYEAAIKFMRIAISAIDEKNIQDAHNNIIRAENILYELVSTLNTEEGGDVAQNLLRLYDYMIWQLVEANTEKNREKVENVIRVMSPLRDAWREVVARQMAAKKEADNKSINFSG